MGLPSPGEWEAKRLAGTVMQKAAYQGESDSEVLELLRVSDLGRYNRTKSCFNKAWGCFEPHSP